MFENYFNKITAIIKNKNITTAKLAVLFIIITGIVLRVKIYLYNQGLWTDELSLVYFNFMKKGFSEFLYPLNDNQVAPPLFLICSKLFFEIGRKINPWLYADLGAKFFSLVCSVLSVFGFYFLLNKVFKNKIYTTVCLLLFCFNPIALSYAQEVKQYSTDLLFSILLIYIFYSINFKEDSIKKLSIYSLISALSLWFSSSAPFVLAAGFCYLLFDFIKNKSYDKKFFIFFTPFILSFLMWFVAYYIPVKEVNYRYMFNYWGKGVQKFLVYDILGIFNREVKALTAFNYILPALISGVFILLYKKEYKILTLVGLPVIFCTIASYNYFYPFELRLILFLLPSFIIISSSFLLLIKENIKSRLALLIFAISAIILQFKHPVSENLYFKTDIRNQVQYIINNKNETEGIYTPSISAFQYYFQLLNTDLKPACIEYPFEKKTADKLFGTLKKNKTYILAIPTIAGFCEEFASDIKAYMKNNKNIEIIEKVISPRGNSIYLIKFKVK